MKGCEVMQRSPVLLIFILLALLGGPGSTSALPTDIADSDESGPSSTGAAANPSLWQEPVASTPTAPASAQAQSSRPEPATSANPLWAIPLAALSNTRERPIFSASRRPPAPAVAAAPVPRAPPPPRPPRVERPQLSLVGTIVGDDESFGIFVDQAGKSALRLRLGEDYQGWTLSSVHGREVVFERDRQSTILALPQPAAGTATQVREQAETSLVRELETQPDRRGRR